MDGIGDRHTQAAILASLKTHRSERPATTAYPNIYRGRGSLAQSNQTYQLRNSSGVRRQTSQRSSLPRPDFGRKNHLAREGIGARTRQDSGLSQGSSKPFIAGSTTGSRRACSASRLQRDSQEDFLFRESRPGTGASNRSTNSRPWNYNGSRPISRSDQSSDVFPPLDSHRQHKQRRRKPPRVRGQPENGPRTNLGGGWWRLSGNDSGTFQKCGLHTVIESSGKKTFLCSWEPLGDHKEALSDALKGGKVGYNLLAQLKCARRSEDTGHNPNHRFYLVFGMQNPSAFYYICANVTDRMWTLEYLEGGNAPTTVTSIIDDSLKPNVFFNLVLKIRDHYMYLESNGLTIFSGISLPGRAQDGEEKSIQGDVGLLACQSKCMLKNWRLEAADDFIPTNCSENGDRVVPILKQPYMGADDQFLVEQIEQDIIDRNLGTTFDDIASLDNAKCLLNEAVVLPLLVPEFFTGIREPWKGVLLFGPPGTGKTMLAKAVAGFNGSTFFNVSTAGLISKYRGESEKLIRTLFNLARHYAPSIVFLDELDALVSSRKSEGEHEASRRLKTEIFVQMDGITSQVVGGNPNDSSDPALRPVMVLATTNLPWDLDEAMRRRLEKRIYIPLPEAEARRTMFEKSLQDLAEPSEIDVEELVQMTEGYSGADISLVCRDALMMPIRRVIAGKSPQEIQEMRAKGDLDVPDVTLHDFKAAISNTRPSVSSQELSKFSEWNKLFGAY